MGTTAEKTGNGFTYSDYVQWPEDERREIAIFPELCLNMWELFEKQLSRQEVENWRLEQRIEKV